MTAAIEAGIPKLRIEEAAARTQARIDSGRQPVIGVNMFRPDTVDDIDVLKVDNTAVRAQQLAKLERLRAERDQAACDDALARLTAAARASADGTRGPGLDAEPAQAVDRRRPGPRARSARSAPPWRRCSAATPRRSVRSPACTATRSARRPTWPRCAPSSTRSPRPRAGGRASSSPRWARTATTAARR